MSSVAPASRRASSAQRAAGFAALLFAVSCWGLGFVATKELLFGMGPLWSMALRLLGAVVFMALPLATVPPWRRGISGAQLRLAAPAGVFVAMMLVLQTIGLATTSVANSGFITTLYVVIMPLLMAAGGKQALTYMHMLWVMTALIGTALMCNIYTVTLLRGDLMTLIAAFGAAAHIIYIDRIATRIVQATAFNILQSLIAGSLALVAALLWEPWRFAPPSPQRWLVSYLFVTLLCTVVAYAYQIKAQKVLPANVASVLFLLESPIAAVAGWGLLHETLSLSQGVGGCLILASALGVSTAHRKDRNGSPQPA